MNGWWVDGRENGRLNECGYKWMDGGGWMDE